MLITTLWTVYQISFTSSGSYSHSMLDDGPASRVFGGDVDNVVRAAAAEFTVGGRRRR